MAGTGRFFDTPTVLLPETAQSYEAGLKGALVDGRLTVSVRESA